MVWRIQRVEKRGKRLFTKTSLHFSFGCLFLSVQSSLGRITLEQTEEKLRADKIPLFSMSCAEI